MSQRPRRHLLAFVALMLMCARAGAQCPDGTPPPCRGAGAAGAAKHGNLAPNERLWIVVPFGNATKAPDLNWLRDASVNLLSLDLSRWTDISVVDDKRVTDLIRELPPTRAAQSLSLGDGLALARRAGAGRLVMGDFYRQGKGARLVANVFSVRDGSRIRSFTQTALDQDSLLSAFGPLARGVLAVPPPPDAKLGAPGTTNVAAYQEYLLGVNALNRFELTDAKQHLARAITLDSTFALAHFKLSTAIHWGDTRGDTTERAQALAAARLGSSLPPRERALISGRVATSGGEYERACATLGALVAKDSSDVEAIYGMGECEYHGGRAEPVAIDSLHGRARGNWNSAIAAFRRVLQLDPTYHPAFVHILDALTTGIITICGVPGPVCGNDASAWKGPVARAGDSLVIRLVRGPSTGGFLDMLAQAENARSPLLNLRAAQRIAKDWVDAGPAESRAHLSLAAVDLLAGDVAQADGELRQIRSRTDLYTRIEALKYRIQVAVLLGRGGEGRALLDTLQRELPRSGASNRDLGPLYAVFGQTARLEAWIEMFAASHHESPAFVQYMRHVPRVMLGVPDTRLLEDERRYWESLPGDSVCRAGRPGCRTSALLPTMAYALRVPRAWWPYRDKSTGFRFHTGYALATGDTAYLRTTQRFIDSIAQARVRSGLDDQASRVLATEAYLAGHDSTAALRAARQFVDSIMPGITKSSSGVGFDDDWSLLLVPRMMLLRADLAAALGARDEARVWYARMLDLWAEADPELQPTVARIRAALAPPTRLAPIP